MRVIIYRNYRFTDKDPIIDALRTVVKTEEKLNNHKASQITGVSTTTFDGWFEGGTRRPQNATVSQVAAALGYVRRDELKPNGEVVIGFVKVNSKIDYQEEIKKQADWLLKHGKQKKRRTRKKKPVTKTKPRSKPHGVHAAL